MFPSYFGFLTKRCWTNDCVKRLVLGCAVCVSINSLGVDPSIGIVGSSLHPGSSFPGSLSSERPVILLCQYKGELCRS